MANAEHVKRLASGVSAWNTWRSNSPKIQADLSGIELADAVRSLKFRFAARPIISSANILTSTFLYFLPVYKGQSITIVISNSLTSTASSMTGIDMESAALVRLSIQLLFILFIFLFIQTFFNIFISQLSFSKFMSLLVGKDSDLSFLDADFSRVDFRETDFQGVNLNRCNFQGANLINSNLAEVKVLDADFNKANMSGACIEGWAVDNKTSFENVKCSHVYLQQNNQERRPSDYRRNFSSGEFAALVQKSLETIDLVFIDGIDWKAFFVSFQELRQKYNDDDLNIQAIERKDEAFLVRIVSNGRTDKAKIEATEKKLYKAQRALERAKNSHKLKDQKIKEKDQQIKDYRKIVDMFDVVRILAMTPKYDYRGARINGPTAENSAQMGNTFNDYSINIDSNIEDIDCLLNSLRNLTQRFPADHQGTIELAVEDLKTDIKTPEKREPKRLGQRLKGLLALGSAAAITSSAAGIATDLNAFTDKVLELSEKLGVPIELVQPSETP